GSGLLLFAFVERKPARFVWETGAVSSPVAERRRRSGATPKAVESMPCALAIVLALALEEFLASAVLDLRIESGTAIGMPTKSFACGGYMLEPPIFSKFFEFNRLAAIFGRQRPDP
ncbi:hypothetical protein, partial [Paraburkholderia sp. EG304]|uniref:hypothetical protein n=1 Tax=Paraburkholderia sp. EG304 TaxID=3237015 RepID=UPI003978CE9B